VVIIAHRAGVLARVDRLLMMRDGVVQLEGPREEVLEKMRATAGRPAAPAGQPTAPSAGQPPQRQVQPQPSPQPAQNPPRRTQ
jgi:ATP-binding cassette subfamily C protein